MVGSAQAIALDNNTSLTVEHVDTVLDVVNSWNTASSSTLDNSKDEAQTAEVDLLL